MSTETNLVTEPQQALPQRWAMTAVWVLTIALIPASVSFLNAQGPATDSAAQPAASNTTTPSTTRSSAVNFTGVTSTAMDSDEYVISPEDVLDVYVYDVPELSREYVVNSAGNITVPLLPKPVQAAGSNPSQLARALEQGFRETGSLSRPQITVTVKQSKRSVVTIEGAVKSPQVVPVVGRTRLTAVLAQCGGLADDAGSSATITRGALAPQAQSTGNTPSGVITIELKNLMDGNDPTSQLEVWPGDRVSIEHAGVFYVLGEVNHPGGFNLKSAQEQVSVLQALAVAGDVTSVSKKNKAFLIRKKSGVANGREQVALNVTDIIAGRAPDTTLQANDILYVPASGGKRALHAITSSATTIAGGAGTALVYRR